MNITSLRHTDLPDQVLVWCWNGHITEYETGEKGLKTVRSKSLYELAEGVWLNNWIPFGEIIWLGKQQRYRGDIEGIKPQLKLALERILRGKPKGRQVPNEPFIEFKEIPEDYLMPKDCEGLIPVKKIEVLDIEDGIILGSKEMIIDDNWIKSKMELERLK